MIVSVYLTVYIIGNIASVVTQSQFKSKFGLDIQTEDEYANTKGWLVSIATAGAVFGCLGVSSPEITVYYSLQDTC